MMSWRNASRVLTTIGCAWLGAPVVTRLWSPTQSLQQVAATPLYALFGVVQIILLACVVGLFQSRPWVAKVLRWCAIGWTVAVFAWVAMSAPGLMSLLMLLAPPGIVGSSAPTTAAAAAPMHYALMALIELWALALLARAGRPAGQQRQPQEAQKTPPASWERSVVWAGIVAAAVHVTIWPALQRSALSGALFHRNAVQLQVTVTPEQWQALSPADQKILQELNEDLALVSKGRAPVHAKTVEYKNSTWYQTRWYEIATSRYQGRVRQVNVIFYSDLWRVVPKPVFFVDWPVRGGASDAASVAG